MSPISCSGSPDHAQSPSDAESRATTLESSRQTSTESELSIYPNQLEYYEHHPSDPMFQEFMGGDDTVDTGAPGSPECADLPPEGSPPYREIGIQAGGGVMSCTRAVQTDPLVGQEESEIVPTRTQTEGTKRSVGSGITHMATKRTRSCSLGDGDDSSSKENIAPGHVKMDKLPRKRQRVVARRQRP